MGSINSPNGTLREATFRAITNFQCSILKNTSKTKGFLCKFWNATLKICYRAQGCFSEGAIWGIDRAHEYSQTTRFRPQISSPSRHPLKNKKNSLHFFQ